MLTEGVNLKKLGAKSHDPFGRNTKTGPPQKKKRLQGNLLIGLCSGRHTTRASVHRIASAALYQSYAEL